MTATEKELYDVKISSVHALITANANVQDEVNKNILAALERIECQTTKTNGRVNALEQDKWKRTGIVIAISSIFSFAVSSIGLYFKFKS